MSAVPFSAIMDLKSLVSVVVILAGSASASLGASITEDFESATAGSGVIPPGWSLVTTAGSPAYVTTADGQGSDGAGGSTGLAGQVSSTAFIEDNLPGGYLVNSTDFDTTADVAGSFDVFAPQEGDFDDVTFIFGDVVSGFSGTDAGQLLSFKLIEPNNVNRLVNGANTALQSTVGSLFQDDTWFHVDFSWTATSGTTGDFEITVSDFTTDLFTLSTTGYTFDSATAQFGFGSVNDTLRFDNVNIVQANNAVVPEPQAFLLVGLLLPILGRRQRRPASRK